MRNTKDYTVISLGEFFELSEVSGIDKIFSSIKKETRKRDFMVNKSLIEYLKTENSTKSKYDILKAGAF